MQSTMLDVPLTTMMLFEHGVSTYPDSLVISHGPEGKRRSTYADIGVRVRRLAAALRQHGLTSGRVVGTLCANSQEHLEAYFSVPGVGAILHTINMRLSGDQIAYVVNDAGDEILIIDAAHVGLIQSLRDHMPTVRLVLVVGGDQLPDPEFFVHYEEFLGTGQDVDIDTSDLEENQPAFICHTSGTTGQPKGVVYSHRARVLHTFSISSGAALGLTERDAVLLIVPMFHVFAWGIPFAGWLVGSDLVMPGRDLSAATLAETINAEAVTCTAAVPTVYIDLIAYSEAKGSSDLTSLRVAWCGGSSVTPALREQFHRRFDVDLVEGWGMTETSAVSTLVRPPKRATEDEVEAARRTAGRILPGVQMRAVDQLTGEILPRDGITVGELEVRGPWVTASYLHGRGGENFNAGWLRTGDLGVIDRRGFVSVVDRLKDVIKSGGEWISASQLEAAITSHGAVLEVAVLAVADARYLERPKAFVVLRPGHTVTPQELAEHLRGRVAKWWIPDDWEFVKALPRTSVGKIDKMLMRSAGHAGEPS